MAHLAISPFMKLEAAGVSFRVGDKAIVTNATVSVKCGKVTALVGPNGAGKSTIVRLLGGGLRSTAGRVTLAGKPLQSFSSLEQARFRSVMGQAAPMAFDFRVREVIAMGWMEPLESSYRLRQDIVAQMAASSGVEHLLERRFRGLSGGEQQMVHFARALIQVWRPKGRKDPRFLLLDEPTSSLDIAHGHAIMVLARNAAERGTGVLIVLHDLNLAAQVADRVSIMKNGRVVADGSPQEVMTENRLSETYGTDVYVLKHPRKQGLAIVS